jgi:predicted ribosome quality control (RQC) complex YloA/Tae2 family protein
LVEEARNHLEYLQELRAMVEVADQMDAIRALRREVASATAAGREPTTPQARGRAARGRPGVPHRRVPLADGWEALVGTSATGNAGVTFDLAQADDVWLHARGVAGAHVIVRRRGPEEPPDRVLERAAELAAWHSAARSSPRVEVDIAARRYVRKIPNAPPGLVRYSHERTLRVTPKSHSVGPSRS